MVMVNLGSTDDSRYTGYREITDRDVLDLQCIKLSVDNLISTLLIDVSTCSAADNILTLSHCC